MVGRHSQGNADGMAVPDDQRDRRLAQGCQHLRQGQAAAHIPAYGINEDQDPVDLRIVLRLGKLRKDVLIFGGLGAARQVFMAFDLPDDGEQMDPSLSSSAKRHLAAFPDPLLLFLFSAGFISHIKNSFPTQFFLFCMKKEFFIHFC